MIGWQTKSQSPDDDIVKNIPLLRERSRDLFSGGATLATGAIKTIVTNVGATLNNDVNVITAVKNVNNETLFTTTDIFTTRLEKDESETCPDHRVNFMRDNAGRGSAGIQRRNHGKQKHRRNLCDNRGAERREIYLHRRHEDPCKQPLQERGIL